MLLTRCFILVSACVALAGPARAWSPAIHGVISLSAFEALSENQQVEVLNLLRKHPQYEAMIAPPEGSDPELEAEIIIFRASTWPDRVAGTEYDRPSWHFVDATRKSRDELADPKPEVNLPRDAAEKPHELNMLQAMLLSYYTFTNSDNPAAERAVALCWTMNLVANKAQPLRLVSLQAPPTFADGDDHGREIFVAGVSLFDLIERYPSRSEKIHDVLDLKKKFQSHTEWDRSYMFGNQSVERAADGEFALKTSALLADTLYIPVNDEIEKAQAEGAMSPLQLGPKSYYKRVLLPDYLPRRSAEAAGMLAAMLADSL